MMSNIEGQSTAIPFIYLQNDKFIVSEEAKQFLSTIKNPICVLTIVGKYRTGKSLFLNRIMLGKSKAFKVSPTINSCTKGLWLWKDSLKFKNEEQQKQVLIIDTQGFGATQQSDAYNNKILLFALLLSSYFVYNSVGSIDENSLNTISVLANLANQIQSKNAKDENIEQYFPSFLWLVRDFTLNLVDKNDFPIQAKEYLQQALQIQKGTSNLIEGKNKIRRMMRHFFTDRDCFTLVRPVQTEDKLQQLDTLQEQNFRETFLQQAKQLRQKILTRIKPKKLKNTLLTGQSLFQLAENYVDVINSNSLPNFQSSYKHLLKIQMGAMKKRIYAQCESKARDLVNNMIQRIKSQRQFTEIKSAFIVDVQKLTKQRIKGHHSLSAFANSEEILMLINEVKLHISGLVDKFFYQIREQMRYEYERIINEIKEDNMMSDWTESIRTQKQFKEFSNAIRDKIDTSLHNTQLKRCPQFMINQFYEANFQPYIQQLQQEFNNLSTKRLSEQNNEMRLKLTIREEYLQEKQNFIHKLQLQLKQEREIRSQTDIRNKILEKQLALYKQNLNQKQESASQTITSLQQENDKLKKQSNIMRHELEFKQQQIMTLNSQVIKKSQQLSFVERQLALTNERLNAKINELNEKKSMIEGLNMVLDEKGSKIQSLTLKIQQLRQSKQNLYERLSQAQDQASIKIVNLEKTNAKLNSEIKECKKVLERTQIMLNQKNNEFKEQLLGQKQRCLKLESLNQGLMQTIKNLQGQVDSYHKKQERYKQFKKCVKNSSSIQCQHCTRFFMSSIFLTHLTVCKNMNNLQRQSQFQNNETHKVQQNQQEITFKVINVVLNENGGKPFTVYQIECSNGAKKWIVEKKFTEFCELNEHLQNSLPGMELSEAQTIFDPKYLSKKSLSVEEKQFLIERYFNDLGKNKSVLNNNYWQQFIYQKSQHVISSQMNTKRSALIEITESINSNSNNSATTKNLGLNYQMRKGHQSKEEPTMVKSGSKQSLRKESLPPEEFFKIWQQKQMRSKPSTACLKKTINNC